jgi:hypothetical protein
MSALDRLQVIIDSRIFIFLFGLSATASGFESTGILDIKVERP